METQASQASKSTDGLNAQLSEVSQSLKEETREKLALNSKLRAMESKKEYLLEHLERESR